MTRRSPLEDTETAAYAWARYRLMMKRLGLLTAAIVALALAALWKTGSAESLHFYIATAIAIAGVMLLTGALMGLVFLSAGTGHDEAVEDRIENPHDDEED